MKSINDDVQTMIIKIEHHTEYSYSEPVYLEPHTLGLSPRYDFSHAVLQSKLEIFPTPAGLSEFIDQDGNLSRIVWFNELTKKLSIFSHVTVKIEKRNPYDFIVFPAYGLKLPMVYPENVRASLEQACKITYDNKNIKDYAKKLADEVQWETVPFLTHMTQDIQKEFHYQRREIGEPYSPVQTIAQRQGSCRDLVLLAMEMCRCVGIACRFVSGYYLFDDLQKNPDLHAWFEAYIPGAGWRGFDPTIGLACYGKHIPLASSVNPNFAASVTGSYRGKAKSNLTVSLEFQEIKEAI